jgi:hypothetical protein
MFYAYRLAVLWPIAGRSEIIGAQATISHLQFSGRMLRQEIRCIAQLAQRPAQRRPMVEPQIVSFSILRSLKNVQQVRPIRGRSGPLCA